MERFTKHWSKHKKNVNIVLIGMRGSGKTSVAKILAKKLNKHYFDIDQLLSKQTCMSIASLVEQYGWEYFRRAESEITKDVAQKDNTVISCGGGVVVEPQNIQALKKNGKVFWLQVSVPTLLKRIGYDTNRPSLTGKSPKEDMEETLKNRYDLYKNAADIVIDTENLNVKEVVEHILPYAMYLKKGENTEVA